MVWWDYINIVLYFRDVSSLPAPR